MSRLQESQPWTELLQPSPSPLRTPDLATMRETFAAGRRDCDSTGCPQTNPSLLSIGLRRAAKPRCLARVFHDCVYACQRFAFEIAINCPFSLWQGEKVADKPDEGGLCVRWCAPKKTHPALSPEAFAATRLCNPTVQSSKRFGGEGTFQSSLYHQHSRECLSGRRIH